MKKLIDKKKLGGFYRQFKRNEGPKAFRGKRIGSFETQGGIGDLVSQGESAISDNFVKHGGRINLSEHREAGERMLGNSELVGGDDVRMGVLGGKFLMIY